MPHDRKRFRRRAEGYELSRGHEGADLVVVNTCGFLDSAQAESLAAIGKALNENGKVIVTGCVGRGDGARIGRAIPMSANRDVMQDSELSPAPAGLFSFGSPQLATERL